ncbi:MAG: DUF6398 domain-containing protein, partial [Candidatus Poribacteria bacterium]|nr:DUF6398 domain-containing protein [Candidatus Poribacteria bacterium]
AALIDELVSMINDFCHTHLNDEYATICLKLIDAVVEEEPSLLLSGRAKSWAGGVLYAIARVNFLFDSSQTPHMRADELCERFGVSQGNATAKSNEIMDALDIHQLDAQWRLESRLGSNPLAQLLQSVGVPFNLGAPEADARRRGGQPMIYMVGHPVLSDDEDDADFSGRWTIVAMEQWDDDEINAHGEAYLEIEEDGSGSFNFLAIDAQIDGKVVPYMGWSRFEFTWAGWDDGTEINGSGWAEILDDENEMEGEFRIHLGDDSMFVAEKQRVRKATKKR